MASPPGVLSTKVFCRSTLMSAVRSGTTAKSLASEPLSHLARRC
jgi:hypothetical protein